MTEEENKKLQKEVAKWAKTRPASEKKDNVRRPEKTTKNGKVFQVRYNQLSKKGFTAVVPLVIIDDPDLKPQEKILFIQISSHSVKRGYCWATDEHFAKKMGLSTRQISRWIRKLKDKEYIYTEYILSNKGRSRRIYINFRTIKERTHVMLSQKENWQRERALRNTIVKHYGRPNYWDKKKKTGG
jgi:hypothetical protein